MPAALHFVERLDAYLAKYEGEIETMAGSRIIQREQALFGNCQGRPPVFALARAMVVLAEELVALAVDPLLLAVRLPA